MKAPAFQFYAADFLIGTMMMTAEQVGAYIRLLCYQWDAGGVPDDDNELSRLAGCSVATAAVVRRKFERGSDGLLRQHRLESVRDEQIARRNAQASNGRNGAQKRWGGHSDPNGVAIATPSNGHWPNDSSPSSSPSSSPDLRISIPPAGAGVQGGTASPPPAVPRAKTPRAPKLPDADWLASLKADPAFAGIDINREHAKASRWCIEKGRTLSRARLLNWLNRCDPTLAGAANGHTTGIAEKLGYTY